MNYYNEFDPHAAAWLRKLIADDLIPQGEVDERSITEVQPADLAGFTQCHFFAGIGGWSLALDLAGWPRDRPVWTGSCPCQPFSSAGKQKAQADERHLWPHFFRLIRECRPDCVFGEQVESAIRHGWLDGIQADLEGEGYAVGHCVLGAHSVGSPHIRQRLYWLADASGTAGQRHAGGLPAAEDGERGSRQLNGNHALGLADGGPTDRPTWPALIGLADDEGQGWPGVESEREAGVGERARTRCDCTVDRVGIAVGTGSQGHAGDGDDGREPGRVGSEPGGPVAAAGRGNYWDDFDIIPCRDGKARRTPSREAQPAFQPLAYGISPGRVGLLRGAGNAIVPQVAAAFIQAFSQA